MAKFGVKITPLPGNKALPTRWRSIIARVSDMIPAWLLIGASFREMETMDFADEGPGWAPTVPDSRQLSILVRTGALKESLIDAFPEMGPSNMFIGTHVPYARYHQEGFVHLGGTSVPARPPVQISDGVIAVWIKIMKDYIFGG